VLKSSFNYETCVGIPSACLVEVEHKLRLGKKIESNLNFTPLNLSVVNLRVGVLRCIQCDDRIGTTTGP